jgi:hypothetical protein
MIQWWGVSSVVTSCRGFGFGLHQIHSSATGIGPRSEVHLTMTQLRDIRTAESGPSTSEARLGRGSGYRSILDV